MRIEDYKKLFISEAEDVLQALEQGMLELEHEGDSSSILNELFRSAHNLKGISGAMGYEAVVNASHAMEEVLDSFKKKNIHPDSGVISLLLEALDCLRYLVAAATGEKESNMYGSEEEAVSRVMSISSEILNRLEKADNTNGNEVLETLTEREGTVEKYEEESKKVEDAFIANEIKGFNRQISTTKVELRKLDKIMDLIGELIISRIRLSSLVEEIGSKALKEEIELSGRLISAMQKEVMEARLIPVGQVFQRFKRLVRDLSAKRGKQVRLELVGEDIGLDRVLLESMVDPIVHIVRNAIDHGIESPEERVAAGKPVEGTIVLSALRERNSVVLTISDDGRGIDIDEVYSRYYGDAQPRGVSKKRNLSPEQLWAIISTPGFSTANVADEISGRGMGMNIVRKAVDVFGGSVNVKTEKGKGTTISMRLPVNLSIVKALLFPAGNEVHAIPIEFIDETSRIEIGAAGKVGGERVFITPEGPIPFLMPEEIFGAEPDFKPERFVKVIVLTTGTRKVALAVREIIGQQDVVIKSLPHVLSRTRVLSGATILGNGKVAFIWDPHAIVEGGTGNESVEEAVLSKD